MVAAVLTAITLTSGASAASAHATSAPAASSVTHHAVVCQRQRGRTILHRGVVRVFKAAGPSYPAVYGCVEGSTRRVLLWEVGAEIPGAGPERTGSLKQVAGRFVAVEAVTSTGQVLDLIGFHNFSRQLATSPPGGIEPASLAFKGQMVTWTQDGEQRSASA